MSAHTTTGRAPATIAPATIALAVTAFLTAAAIADELEPVHGPIQAIYTADNAPDAPALEDLPEVTTLSQFGVTWTFAEPVRVGRFINGDYYIVGPARIVEIDPAPAFGEAVRENYELLDATRNEAEEYPGVWARHGSTLNLPVSNALGFDSRARRYDPDLFTPLPIDMQPGDMLFSSISAPNEELERNGRRISHSKEVRRAVVLTSVAEPLPPDAFRPSYVDHNASPMDERRIFLARDLHRERLYNLPRPEAEPHRGGGQLGRMALANHVAQRTDSLVLEWAGVFQLPWIDTVEYGFGIPRDNRPGYGQRFAQGISLINLMLHLDYDEHEKEKLLINYVQFGIDLWGIVQTGVLDPSSAAGSGYGLWTGHGGHATGRKWTILFAGLMFDDEDMLKLSETGIPFGEDTQTTWGESWTGAKVVFTSHPKWADESPELVHPSGWTEMQAEDSGRRGWQSEGYRRCCTSIVFPGQTLAAHLMRATEYWDHAPYFAYVDRWMTEDNAATARVVVDQAREEQRSTSEWYLTQSPADDFSQALWDAYRNNLPAPRPGVRETAAGVPDHETWR